MSVQQDEQLAVSILFHCKILWVSNKMQQLAVSILWVSNKMQQLAVSILWVSNKMQQLAVSILWVSNKMQQLAVSILFHRKITLHVSGALCTHHQEYIKLQMQPLVGLRNPSEPALQRSMNSTFNEGI
jgi:hypothetical protein